MKLLTVTILSLLLASTSPRPIQLTDDVLFGDVWERKELSKRDRSLITVAALVAGGNAEQLTFHLNRARENGVTEAELIETITHLAFYSGWPKAMSAITVAKEVFKKQPYYNNKTELLAHPEPAARMRVWPRGRPADNHERNLDESWHCRFGFDGRQARDDFRASRT